VAFQTGTQQVHLPSNHDPEVVSTGLRIIEHKPENRAAKKDGLMKGRCIQCMIAKVEVSAENKFETGTANNAALSVEVAVKTGIAVIDVKGTTSISTVEVLYQASL
jgi:hypothetical protein